MKGLIGKHFDVRPTEIIRIGGYSNQNYLLRDSFDCEYILRVSRKNRSRASILSEMHVLYHLRRQGYVNCPMILDMRLSIPVIHLFKKIAGEPPCLWWERCSDETFCRAFESLAALHAALARVPSIDTATSRQLPSRPPHRLVRTKTSRYVLLNWNRFLNHAKKLNSNVKEAFPWDKSRKQWIHGDIQMENLLFTSDCLEAFLDFETVRIDYCEKDLIFSAFRMSREGKEDSVFHYDPLRLRQGIACYRRINTSLSDDFFIDYDYLWKPYFCLDQAFVYLRNACDGVWNLEENIGFLPCFNEVLNYR